MHQSTDNVTKPGTEVSYYNRLNIFVLNLKNWRIL